MDLFSQPSRSHQNKEKGFNQMWMGYQNEEKCQRVNTEPSDPFWTENTIHSSENQARIKIPNSSTTIDFMCLREDSFDPPIIPFISISCIDGLRRFSEMNSRIKQQKPGTMPVERQSLLDSIVTPVNQYQLTSNKGLLEEYENFHSQLLNPNKQSILKSKGPEKKKIRLVTESQKQKQLKPLFISLSSKVRNKKEMPLKKQTSSFFCCGSLENIEQDSEPPSYISKRRYYYNK